MYTQLIPNKSIFHISFQLSLIRNLSFPVCHKQSENVMTDRSHQIALNLQPAAVAKLERLRYLSNLWDNALRIPGTNLRVGLESLIGILPFGGDVIGLLLSCYILFHAIQFKLPKTILLRMVSNIIRLFIT